MKVVFTRSDLRFVEIDEHDYRMQELNQHTKRWNDCYLFAGKEQMFIALEDFDYALMLAGRPCYIKDVVRGHKHTLSHS